MKKLGQKLYVLLVRFGLMKMKPEMPKVPEIEKDLGPKERELREELARRMKLAIDKLKGEAQSKQDDVITKKLTWTVPKPPPGVVPKDAKLAMDAAMDGYGEWVMGYNMFAEGQAFLGYPYLSELAQRPEYRVISSTWAEEMTRKWIRITSTGDDEIKTKADKIKKLEDAMKRFNIQQLFKDAIEKDGFFGRSHIYIDLGVDENNVEELKQSIGNLKNLDLTAKAKVRKGRLKGFKLVEPVWTYPNAYNSTNPLAQDFFQPKTWFVMGKEIHTTRMLTFVGRPVPDLLKPMYAFGGLSLSQMSKPYVDNWLRTRQSVSDAISNFSIMVLLTDMSTMLQKNATLDLVTRAEFFNAARDNRGLMIVDKNAEDLKNVSMSLSGLDHLQAQSQEHVCSVSQIPLVKYTGLSPSGLNASSEGEIKVFYDKVKGSQEAQLDDKMQIVLNLLQLNEFGEIDPEIGFVWNPLEEESTSEQATTQKTQADTDCAYIDRGVLSAQEVRVKLAAAPDSPYASLDTSEEALPEVPGQEEPGSETDESGQSLLEQMTGGGGPDDQGGGGAPQLPGKSKPGEDANENHGTNGQFTSSGGEHDTTKPEKNSKFHMHDYGDWEPADKDQDTTNTMYKYGLQASHQRKCKTCGTKQYRVGGHDGAMEMTEDEIMKSAACDIKPKCTHDERLAYDNAVGVVFAIMAMDEKKFDESKHPRAKNGQFGSGGGAAAPKMSFSDTITSVLKEHGFKIKKGVINGEETKWYEGPGGVKISVGPATTGKKFTSAWVSNKEGKKEITGPNAKALVDLLTRSGSKAGKATSVNVGEETGDKASKILSKHGFDPLQAADVIETPGGNQIGMFTKSKDTYVAVVLTGKNAGKWISKSSGHMAKNGDDLDTLDKLMSGDKDVLKKTTNLQGGATPENLADTGNPYAPQPAAKPAAAAKKPSSTSEEGEHKEVTLTKSQLFTFHALKKGRPTPTDVELKAIRSYTNGSYNDINKGLRHTTTYAKQSTTVKNLTEYLNKCSLPEDATLYRRVSGDYAKILKSILSKGTVFVDHGFVSMSAGSNKWSGDLTMKIKAPKGSKAIAVGDIGSHPSEWEITGQRGSRFKITGFNRNTQEIECELLPPEEDYFK